VGKIVFLSGAAGTGKTHNLIACIKKWVSDNPLQSHQKVLAITRMHGSRRRLVERFRSECPGLRYEISTIDAFCFAVVNRARKALGINRTIIPIEKVMARYENHLGVFISLNEIQELAVRVVASKTYGSLISSGFPVIALDEFQDNSGNLLEFVKQLSRVSDLILAADYFQSLDCITTAGDWLESPDLRDRIERIELSTNHRCSNPHILDAALAIRSNTALTENKIPFLHSANYIVASWKLMPWTHQSGTCCVISPIGADLVQLIKNAHQQIAKRKAQGKGIPHLPRWHFSRSREEIKQELIKVLSEYVQTGNKPSQKIFDMAIERLVSISRLKGIEKSNPEIIEFVASETASKSSHSSGRSFKHELLTIHAAKNREFDNVLVFWPLNKMGKWGDEEKRRLLYNAITRARKSCEVLVLGPEAKIKSCPVLTLLGTSKSQF
jgi:superfamily I DNA/RNA helicase